MLLPALVAVLEERQFSSLSLQPNVVRNQSLTLTLRYSLLYGSRGANVVVNDFNKEAAQKVVDEINAGEPLSVFRTSATFDCREHCR